jgi:arylformamidase
MRAKLILLVATLLGAAELPAQQNIAYGPAERQRLDVYTPKSEQPAPVVLWIHGGAWKFGDKSHLNGKAEWLTGEGWALVAMNYRFVPQVTWREQAADVAEAVKWIQTSGAKHELDASRIVLMGHSAGAHLAALASTDEQYFQRAKIDPTAIVGVVLIDGAGYEVARQAKFARGWLGNVYEEVFTADVKEQHAASPVRQVTARDHWPQFLILHCANRVASTQQAKLLGDALKGAGAKATSYAAEEKNHMTINRELGTAEDVPTTAINDLLNSFQPQPRK